MDIAKRTRQALALALSAAGALAFQSAVAAPKQDAEPQARPAAHAPKKPVKPAVKTALKPVAKHKPAQPAKPTQVTKPTRTAKSAPPAKPKPAVKPHPAAQPVVRNVPMPPRKPRPAVATASLAALDTRAAPPAIRPTVAPPMPPPSVPFVAAPGAATSPEDIAAVKRVIEDARRGKEADAEAAERSIGDPVARKLAEYVMLRSDNTNPTFARYAAFVTANPSWPHALLFRRRAENALWNDSVDNKTVLAFFAGHQPRTAKGRYMLARALLAEGDRAEAMALVRYAWRYEDCSAEVESKALEMFGGMLTRADHKARMDQRFYAEDIEAGMRAAKRLGGEELAIARARAAVIKHLHNAKALLDAVPVAARQDPGYVFARAQWLRKENKPEEAARLMLSVPQDAAALGDPNQWWKERRILVRAMLDRGDAHAAYRLAREAAVPTQGNYRVDRYFTAGWIALRYLHDPAAAAAQFAHISESAHSPFALARGGYWQGRTAEAMGHHAQARAYYQAAAQYTATYYGQLARARLGLRDLGLRGPLAFPPHEQHVLKNLEIVRAVEILYALGERDMLASIFAELGEHGTDVAGMAALAEVAGRHQDGRAMLLLGEAAYHRGLPFEHYAYPVVGLPGYRPIAPPLDPAVAYSIARQESHFNQKVVSSAHAMGLMQVTPEAAIDTAKRFKASYNRARLLSDPVYNMQMGAAELSNLLIGYNGSYILTFAGYNAGRGRVKQWIEAYGDPRDPKVDPVDWVERIPISETRNYVERIMENLQVYRARFGGGSRLMIEADLRRGATN